MCVYETELYTLTGRIWLGNQTPKVKDQDKLLKEDIVLFDIAGKIDVTMWNPPPPLSENALNCKTW